MAEVVTVTGLMTYERWRALWNDGQYVRIFLNGVNVTSACESADDRAGWVVIERYDSFTRKSVREIVTGSVRYEVVAERGNS